MKKLTRVSVTFLGLIVSFFIFFSTSPQLAFSETAPMEDAAYQEVLRLRSLKVSDPEKYRAEIEAKRENIKSQIQDWKSNQPEKYQSFLKQDQNVRKNKIQHFRERHPEEFRQFAKNRIKKFEDLRQNNPEKFKRVMADHPGFEKRLEHPSKVPQGRPAAERFEKKSPVMTGQNPEKIRPSERPENSRPINRHDFEKRRLENRKNESSAPSILHPEIQRDTHRPREKKRGFGNLDGVNGGSPVALEGKPLMEDRKPGNPEGQVRGNSGGSANKPLARKGRRERA